MFDFIVKEYGKKKDRELLYHILNHQHTIMATLAEVQTSLDTLKTDVAAIPTAPAAGAATEADLDGIKSQIDAIDATVKTINQPAATV